jgi:hypothetical protein
VECHVVKRLKECETDIKTYSPDQRAEKFEETKKEKRRLEITKRKNEIIKRKNEAKKMELLCDPKTLLQDALIKAEAIENYCHEERALSELTQDSRADARRRAEIKCIERRNTDKYNNQNLCEDYNNAKLKHELKKLPQSKSNEKLQETEKARKHQKNSIRKEAYANMMEKRCDPKTLANDVFEKEKGKKWKSL